MVRNSCFLRECDAMICLIVLLSSWPWSRPINEGPSDPINEHTMWQSTYQTTRKHVCSFQPNTSLQVRVLHLHVRILSCFLFLPHPRAPLVLVPWNKKADFAMAMASASPLSHKSFSKPVSVICQTNDFGGKFIYLVPIKRVVIFSLSLASYWIFRWKGRLFQQAMH